MARSARRKTRPTSGTKTRKLRAAEEWVGGRASMPAYVMEGGPFRPEIVLWLDATNDLIVGSELGKPGQPVDVIVDVLLAAIKKPMAGPPRTPSSVRVADPALAELLRSRLGSDVEIRVAPAPELDRVMALMTASFTRDDQAASYLEDGNVSAQTIGRFFKAAAKLWRVAPWKVVNDSQLLQLDCPELEARNKCISIIGNLGESYGILVFDSVGDYCVMAERGEAFAAGNPLEDLGTHLFSINFDRGSDIPKAMRREVAQYGWEVSDANAYPRVQWADPDKMLRPLVERDLVFATACAEAVADFFTAHSDEIEAGELKSARERVFLGDLPGQPTVELNAPHPDTERLSESDEPGGEDDIDAQLAVGHEIAEAFVAAQEREGHDEGWLSAADFISDSLYSFKINYADGSASGWTAALIKEYLLGYFPRKVSADEELIDQTPEILTAFFDWMESEGRVNRRTALAIRKCVAANRKRFAGGPVRTGPGAIRR